MQEMENKGETLINWHLGTFPRDARLVLRIRQASRRYQEDYGFKGPVADLEAEEKLLNISPNLRTMQTQVGQPVTFLLPTFILRVLSYFERPNR